MLRDGRVAGTVVTGAVTKDDIVRLIVGRVVDLEAMRPHGRQLARPSIASTASGGIAEDFSLALAPARSSA